MSVNHYADAIGSALAPTHPDDVADSDDRLVSMHRVRPRVSLETARQFANGGIDLRNVRIARTAADALMALAGLALRTIASFVTHSTCR